MAVTAPLRITEECIGCDACPPLCPTAAIENRKGIFVINPKECVGCEDYYDLPQCGEVCPVEGAIVDGAGRGINPSGSLN